MEFDENKKLDVEISAHPFVENRVNEKRKRRAFRSKLDLDALDVAIIPVAIGVFLSLGFLFANLFRATSIVDVVGDLSAFLANTL